MRRYWGKTVRRVFNSDGIEAGLTMSRYECLNVSYVPISRACQPQDCYVNALYQEWD